MNLDYEKLGRAFISQAFENISRLSNAVVWNSEDQVASCNVCGREIEADGNGHRDCCIYIGLIQNKQSIARAVIAASGLLEEVERLRATVKRVEEVAAKYDGLAKKLKNNCQCCGCYDCSAWRIYELVEDDITTALKGPQ